MSDTNDDPALASLSAKGAWKKAHDPMAGMFGNAHNIPALTSAAKRNSLDSEKNRRLFKTLYGMVSLELQRQAENRQQQHIDCDYYDGIQWTDAEAQRLKDRGQDPLTFNIIATTINWLLGTEKRGRTDYKVLPRHDDGSKVAELKSQILKYLSDVNRTAYDESDAFADCVKAGVGWMETCLQEGDDGEPITERYESWRHMVWDSLCRDRDLKTARFVSRIKWCDADIISALFKNRAHIVREAATGVTSFANSLDGISDTALDSMEEGYAANAALSSSDSNFERQRVRVMEVWFQTIAEDDWIQGGQFHGELADHASEGHKADLISGEATVVRRARMRMFVAIMTDKGLLYLSKSPYRHNRYPFTPIWCYRRDADNLPYGVIRGMRDPQSDVNKRAAKALHILNTNKIIMDDDAVDDVEAFAEEAANPDAILLVKRGARVDMNVDRDLAPAHLELMRVSEARIQTMSGVTDENMGRTTNATSGKAIIARQDQGSLATASIFDNHRFARQVRGEKLLSLVEQFMEGEKQIRITNMRGNPQFLRVNDGVPENDIVATKADFILGEDDFNETMRQAQVASLMELLAQIGPVAPQVVMAVLDLVVETMDVPQREELVKRIRQITGQADPDADPNNPDPETQAQNAAKQAQAELQQRAQNAEIALQEAKAAEAAAKAEATKAGVEKTLADVQRILAQTKGEDVRTQAEAIQAAMAIIQSQGAAAPTADEILANAGYSASTPAQPAPAAPPMPPVEQGMQPPMAAPAQEQPTQAPIEGMPL